jgi:bla regulator protein blaR1
MFELPAPMAGVGIGIVTPLVGWALTYLLHSTVALAGAWMLERTRLVERPAARDVLWKLALIGGLITASVQLGGYTGLGGVAAVGVDVRSSPVAVDGASWLVALPWALVAFWGGGASVAGVLWWFRSSALRALLAGREVVAGGYARQVLDELQRQNPRLGTVELFRVEGLESPAALGRRAIGLPARAAELPSEELRVAMAHEVAHLVRNDPLWIAVTNTLSTLFFFQPLNLLAVGRLRESAELLADDWAVVRTGAPLSLARSLARVAEWLTPEHPSPELAMAGGDGAALGRRVERILGESNRRPVTRRQMFGFSIILFLVLAWVPSVRLHVPRGSPGGHRAFVMKVLVETTVDSVRLPGR